MTVVIGKMTTSALLVSAALLSSATADCAAQSTAPYSGAWTVTIENDTFTGSDNNYTNGIGVSWVSSPSTPTRRRSIVRRWAKFWSFLPFVGKDGYRTYVAWSLAQEMHTPDDITHREPAAGRPALCRRAVPRQRHLRAKRTRTHAWQLRVGVVGPASQADHVQKSFHKLVGADEPMGWHTQLPNEPVINVGYTGAYLWRRDN